MESTCKETITVNSLKKIINEKNGKGHYNIIPVGNIYGYVKSKLSGLRNGK